MSATGRSDVRVESDYYPTPAWCVHRLLEAVYLPAGEWLEPCVGGGAIVRAVVRADVQWTTYDIRPESSAQNIGDFLSVRPRVLLWEPEVVSPWASVCLTNPPYSLALEFVQLRAQVEEARRERDDARLAAEQGVLVARDLEERLRAERAAGMELRASLVEAATFARGTVGKCDCLTCAPSQQLAERWERQARGTEASHG